MAPGCYRRFMAVRLRLTVILAALALVASACGASSASNADGAASTGETAEATGTAEGQGGGASAVAIDLGDLEAGFGPGSLVAGADGTLRRLNDLPEMWTAFVQPYTYQPLPEVCGVADPVAVSGIVLSYLDPSERLFFDTVVGQVLVFDTVEQAANAVEVVNGPTAAECDMAGLAQIFEDGLPASGLEFDFGDGIGTPADNPPSVSAEFDAETRRFEGSLMAGSISRDLIQVETSAASGHTLIRLSTISASGRADDVLLEAGALLLSEGVAEVSQDPELDDVVNQVRASLLTIDDVPEFYEPSETIRVSFDSADPESCFELGAGQVRVEGSNWAAVSPGAGVSRLWQLTTIYEDEAAATASFDELVELGADCFVESLQLPDDQFRVTGRAFETANIDGVEVALFRLDVTQFVNGQEFEIEGGFGGAQIDRFTTGVNFFGLIGDSPDLGELAATAAQRLVAE